MASDLTEAMTKLVGVLSPLSQEERIRVVNASLTLLGEGASAAAKPGATQAGNLAGGANLVSISGLSPQAGAWLSKHSVKQEDLEEWFYFDQDKVTPLALPGDATQRSQQVVNAYLVKGLAAFLATGDASFDDQDARDLCTHFGCYDKTNHSKVFKTFGNKFTGSKSSGWKLTAPGLNAAAALIKGNTAA